MIFIGQWIPCGTAKDTKANITGLQEGKPYKFRVKAVNKEGESEELETEKSIIAKNPFGLYIIFNGYVNMSKECIVVARDFSNA